MEKNKTGRKKKLSHIFQKPESSSEEFESGFSGSILDRSALCQSIEKLQT